MKLYGYCRSTTSYRVRAALNLKGLPYHTAAADLADLCLVAQVYNARRWNVDLALYPKICKGEAACRAVPEIVAAHPATQPDAEVIV